MGRKVLRGHCAAVRLPAPGVLSGMPQGASGHWARWHVFGRLQQAPKAQGTRRRWQRGAQVGAATSGATGYRAHEGTARRRRRRAPLGMGAAWPWCQGRPRAPAGSSTPQAPTGGGPKTRRPGGGGPARRRPAPTCLQRDVLPDVARHWVVTTTVHFERERGTHNHTS